jgi:hypothetical protein
MKKTIVTMAMAVLAACGANAGNTSGNKDTTNKTPLGTPEATASSTGAWAVESEADLPTCDAARKGQLVFVESDETFRVCRLSGWSVIDLKGADGEDGTNGKDGKNGTNGAAGAAGAPGPKGATGATGPTGAGGGTGATGGAFDVIAKIDCYKEDGDWNLQYTVAEFANHSVFVSCSAAGPAFQSSNSTLYSANQQGGFTGYCSTIYDASGTANYGQWIFTYSPDLQAEYWDVDLSTTGAAYTSAFTSTEDPNATADCLLTFEQ